MDDTEDIAEDTGPRLVEPGPVDPVADPALPPSADQPVVDDAPADPGLTPGDPSMPGIYILRPRGLRPAPRPARPRRARLRNDCPPDRRRPSGRPPLKPRLR